MALFHKLQTRDELAARLDIPLKKLTYILYIRGVENCYTTFSVPKRLGGERQISAPIDELKDIQRKMAKLLQQDKTERQSRNDRLPVISHGFEPGKSILTNARIHRNKRYVLNLDLEDFFGSIHFGRVLGYFKKNKAFEVSHEVATAMAQLCCYQGKLPQGAPTSPVVANLVSEILDYRLLKVARKYHLDYTRYADDLSFSTNDSKFLDNYDAFYREIDSEIRRAGYSINAKKIRLQYRDSRQTVTGLTVNKIINVDRRYYKETRAMAHQLYETGSFQINGVPSTLAQLEGRFAFIYRFDLENSDHKKEKQPARKLTAREKQYQKFLFYKTFLANDIPLIVTEGKTDILYIKAALMNLHEHYPSLVTKNPDNTFDFKIRFFRKSDRWRYLFDISLDGADTLQNIFDFHVGRNSRPDYISIFSKHHSLKSNQPVFLVFDNELANKDKPISKFVNRLGDPELARNEIKKRLSTKVVDKGKLYLITHQLHEGVKEGEIESLFTEETRGIKLSGKSLTLKDRFDTSKFFGKDIFSNYVLDNYATIDFSGFRPLLDTMVDIIGEEQNIETVASVR